LRQADSFRLPPVSRTPVCRKDPNTPIEETVKAMKELVEEGKVKHIGLSEVGQWLTETLASL
jgi:aryl-alcohol dehydrogenase-like predicted oxidoreductase